MKKVLLLFIIISASLRVSADVGNAYKYLATLNLSDNREITGYFYFTTY